MVSFFPGARNAGASRNLASRPPGGTPARSTGSSMHAMRRRMARENGRARPRLHALPLLPPFWTPLHQASPRAPAVPSKLPPGLKLRVDEAAALFRLALSAKGIPHRVLTERDHVSVYIPPLLSPLARHEVLACLAESRPERPRPPLPAHDNFFSVIICLLFLVAWHAVTRGATPLFPSLGAEDWISIGAADAMRMAQGGQWYRALTALTLHGDSPHMLGNALFGAVFLVPLCRRAGFGPGIFLCILAGAIGNILNAWLQPPQHVSIGFSTSVFGAVGALCGLYGASAQRARLWVVLGAGLALLALLGSEGARTDIMAHLFGLLCGFFLGIFLGTLLRRHPEFFASRAWRRVGQGLGAIALLSIAGAWAYALNLRFAAM